MQRAALRWVVPATVLFLLFLLLTLPARHVWGWLGDGQLAVQDLQGTLWNGRAVRIVHPAFSIGPLVWQLRPQALLLGRLEYQVFVQSDAGGGELRAGIGLFKGRYIADAHLTQPAAGLGHRLSNNMLALAGDFQLDLELLEFSSAQLSALQGVLVWHDARLVQPSAMALGDLQMQLSLRGDLLVGTLADAGGALEMTGEVQVGLDRSYQLDAQLKPRATAEANLRDSLSLLGSPNAQGRYQLRYSGKF